MSLGLTLTYDLFSDELKFQSQRCLCLRRQGLEALGAGQPGLHRPLRTGQQGELLPGGQVAFAALPRSAVRSQVCRT